MEPRVSFITLGVSDLAGATRFYRDVLGLPQKPTPPTVAFSEMGKTWLSLYPRLLPAGGSADADDVQRHAALLRKGKRLGHLAAPRLTIGDQHERLRVGGIARPMASSPGLRETSRDMESMGVVLAFAPQLIQLAGGR